MTGYREDAWLTGLFGRPAFRVESPAEAAAAAAELDHKHPRSFAWARIGAGDAGAAKALCAKGFHPVDVTLTFSLKPGASPKTSGVAPARPDQHAELLRIAGSCFTYSRFHLDPQVPRELADRIKREWIASYCAGRRGEVLLAAELEGKTAGFLAVLADDSGGRKRRVIDLIGVDPKLQGKGVGRALIGHFIARYKDCDELLVGTQAANLPSIKAYEAAGFRLARASLVLHRHGA